MNTKDSIKTFLSTEIATRVSTENISEIRLRVDKPLIIKQGSKEHKHNYNPTITDIRETMERISQYSFYAMEEELRMGYITLPGGHRVGVVGKAVVENGQIKTIRPISGVNIRISRAVNGCGDSILPQLLDKKSNNKLPHNTMIISPPGCGKTTLLRDIIRQFSDNCELTVGVVDERSEIGNIGLRTDLLDSSPKAEGMILLLRAMSPDVIAVDELGGAKDAQAVEDVSNAGVRLLCTVHGYDVCDIMQKPSLRQLLDKGIFKKFVVLTKPGEEGQVYDSN